MNKEEVVGLLDGCIKENVLEDTDVTFTTKQYVFIHCDKNTEIYFLNSSLQVNSEEATNLIAYSEIALITIT